jgi:hypothetical protein
MNEPMDAREARAEAAAAKARAKSMRPWYRKKRFILPLAVVALIVLASVASGGGSDDDKSSGADSKVSTSGSGETKSNALYPDRPDRHKEDHEAELGQPVELSGYTATLKAAAVESQQFGEDEIVIDVEISNRDDRAQPYSPFDWKLQTPEGQVVDATISLDDNALDSGDLVQGGKVAGRVAFDQNASGTYYVIYKPDPFDAARGIWKITV